MAGDGSLTLVLCGAEREIKLNWKALAALRERFGVDFQSVVWRGLQENDPTIIAHTLAAGSGVDFDAIMEDSPPLIEAIGVISICLRRAISGPVIRGAQSPLARAVAAIRKALRQTFTLKPSPIGWAA